ncbi:MAG: hypothetical protein WAZ98_11420 [Cyclobacteriaceae bacterium]
MPLCGSAQLQQDDRLEIPIFSDQETFDAIPATDAGILLFRQAESRSGNALELIHLDTLLHQQWRGSLPLDQRLTLEKKVVFKNTLFLIFRHSNFTSANFHLYRIDVKTGNYIKFIIHNVLPFIPTVFSVTSNGTLLGGYFNRVPVVLFFDFKTQKSKVLPGLFNEPGELNQLKINEDESFDILISAKNYQKQQTIWVKNYDPTGKLIRNVMLQPDGNHNLIFGRTIQMNNKDQIIAGVYGNRSGEYSNGLFIARLTADDLQQMHYYNFADLENFFNYLRPKKINRIKERIQRKKVKGKKIKFQYNLIVHELLADQNQFILLGEAFYKKYRTLESQSIMSSSYNRPIIFDGYQYTHAVLLGIDLNGKLLWDNSFEINDVRTFTLEQFVKIDVQNDKIVLLYLFDNKLRSKIIQDNTVLEGKSSNDIRLNSAEDLSSEDGTNISRLEYWYGNHFMAYGVQDVVSNTFSLRKKKKVFFVNKISYR